jgi:hypothetical protein
MNMKDRVLNETDMDRLGQAIITLTRELWVMKDRQRILEAVLADAGLLDSVAVDAYEPDESLEEELKAERQKLINEIIRALAVSAEPE